MPDLSTEATSDAAGTSIADRKPRKLSRNILPAQRFKTRQRGHFIICVVLPTLLAGVLPLVMASGWFSLAGIGLWAVMWFLVGGVGVSVGLHRHFSHRAFAAKPFLRTAMAVFGCMAGQGTARFATGCHCTAATTPTVTNRVMRTRPCQQRTACPAAWLRLHKVTSAGCGGTTCRRPSATQLT